MVCFFACSICLKVLSIFYHFLLSAALENYTSNLDYETFFENESYADHSEWENISTMNVTDASSNTELYNLPFWYNLSASRENICICDLYYDTCDINCCCDSDCSEDDMKVFSSCNSQVALEENYCYLTDIILKNNAVKDQQNPNKGLFCIAHNNLEQFLRYNDLPILKSHRDLDVLLKYQSKMFYSWEDTQVRETKDYIMKSGRPIPIIISQTETVWNLPNPCFGQARTCKRKVLYLEDYNSTCTITINNLRNECESNENLSANSYINFCLSSQKRGLLFAHSMISNELISDDNWLCFTKTVEKPTYQSNTCFNVVSQVHFTVRHNGILGIKEIIPTFNFLNLSSDNSTVTQHFNVEFRWHNSTETNIKRSGNPGYQVGLPIVTGTNSSDSMKIKIQPGGLSIFDKDSLSRCKGRKSVKFGKNLKSSCYVKINININDCKATQEKIYNVLLGSSRDLFIGMFGNANESNREEWIEAYHEEENEFSNIDSVCHLITGLKINVVYAAAGTVQNPQYKIFGLGYHNTNFVELSNGEQIIILSASVSFFDVTDPVIPHYPKAPSLKVDLPSDFFYPFLQES